jgi:hypothetical protein
MKTAFGRQGRRRERAREDDELSPAQRRELRRRLTDLRDPIRYLLVSKMGRRFALYYNVAEDVYPWNDPRGATLFKRRDAALAVKTHLGRHIRVIRCNSRQRSGVRVPVLRTARSGVTAASSSQDLRSRRRAGRPPRRLRRAGR